MIYGYIRTSTKRQKPDSQKMSIERWAKEHELPIDEYIEDLAVLLAYTHATDFAR